MRSLQAPVDNQGDGNPNASGGSCTSGCTAKYRVFSTHYLNGGSTVWTHHGSYTVAFGQTTSSWVVGGRYLLIGREDNHPDESDPRVREVYPWQYNP